MVSVKRRPSGGSKKTKQQYLLLSLRISAIGVCLFFIRAGPLFHHHDKLVVVEPESEQSLLHAKAEAESESLPTPPLRLTPEKATDMYRTTVESYVQQQTMSWHPHYTGLQKDVRTDAEIRDARLAQVSDRNGQLQAYLRNHHKELLPPDLSATTNDEHQRNAKELSVTNINDQEEEEDFIWDSDEDIIPAYFNRLIANCGATRNATTSVETFQNNCFGLIQELIWKPRCTVNLDSRYTCNGKAQQQQQDDALSVKDLLATHFTKQTLNVVVVGAGPSGLQLANGLAGLAENADGGESNNNSSSNNTDNIRVAVFESRSSEPGRKRPYSRNWILHLTSKFLEDVVDPVMQKLMAVLHAPGRVQLPLHFYETLLLLNTRTRGVKFIYDDVQNYMEELAQIPNLLIFDATGHRLDHFEVARRDAADPADSAPTTIAEPWSWEPMTSQKRFFSKDSYQQFQQTNSVVQIAERTTVTGNKVLCPVLPNGQVYRAHMLKVNDVRLPAKNWRDMTQLSFKLRSTNTADPHQSASLSPSSEGGIGVGFCQSQQAKHRTCKPVGGNNNICRKWCGRLYTWSSGEQYRKDIARDMVNHPPKGVATTVMFASLSGEQADGMAYMMGDARGEISTKHKRPFVPLSEIPFRAMSKMNLFQKNQFEVILRALADLPPSAATSQVNLFTYQPYLYKDPVNRADIKLNDIAAVLRVGDSLASGDPNLSTGLMFHMQVIQSFIRTIRKEMLPSVGGEKASDVSAAKQTVPTSNRVRTSASARPMQ